MSASSSSQDHQFPFGPKLKPLAKAVIPIPSLISENKHVEIHALAGSMLDFTGDCCVNACNEGGVTGFGVDEMVNRAGGNEMKDARRLFNGVPTGTAKYTQSYNHKKVKYVIHACGPVFRDNSMNTDSPEKKQEQLKTAYSSSMKIAHELGCKDIAFCLISAGVFRGHVPLDKVLSLGIQGVLDFYQTTNFAVKKVEGEGIVKDKDTEVKPPPLTVCLCAFTPEEQRALAKVVSNLAV